MDADADDGRVRPAVWLINTVHDHIYYVNRTPPRDLPWIIRVVWRLYHLAWWPQRILLNAADEVVTISYTTEALIGAHHHETPGVGGEQCRRPTRRRRAARRAGRTQPGLYMGSYMPYKNVETLAAGMDELPGYTLHIQSRASEEVQDRLGALSFAGSLEFHGGVSDESTSLLDSATASSTPRGTRVSGSPWSRRCPVARR